MNPRLLFLVLGAIIGGAIGYLTAPEKVLDVSIGDIKVTATKTDGGVTVGQGSNFLADPATRTILFAVIGGVVGLVLGQVGMRGRRS